MADTISPVAAPSGANIASLLDLIKGSSSSTSTKSNISAEGMQSLLNQILSGNQGLASIAGGTKAGGGYNSSTQTLLTNDLLTRATGQLASQQAGSTTTKTTPSRLSGSDLLGTLALMGGKKILGPSIAGASKKFGLDGIGEDLANTLGLGSGSSAGGFVPINTAGALEGTGAGSMTAMESLLGSGVEAGTLGSAGAVDTLGSLGGLEGIGADAASTDFFASLFGDAAGEELLGALLL